jgi:hypothetical protein
MSDFESESAAKAARPVGELRERAGELPFQASDVDAVAAALKPLQHQRHILAVLPEPIRLFDWRLRERNRPTQRLCQDFRRLRHRSYVTDEIDLAAVQDGGGRERPRGEPADVVHPQSSAASFPTPSAQPSVSPWRL